MPDPSVDPVILTVNGGSSSVKFAVFSADPQPILRLHGQIERIGQPNPRLVVYPQPGAPAQISPITAADHAAAARALIQSLQSLLGSSPVAGVGHRVVHGGIHLLQHQPITPALLEELRAAQPLDLAHLPREISLIESFRQAYPAPPHIACFDAAFHRHLPRLAQLLPIPRRYLDAGIRRFGFHGLSYTYLLQRLQSIAGQTAANSRLILAHLGAGASMAAVHHGKPVDTTMAFTPTAGLMMGARPGDLDPGLLVYLARSEKLNPDQLDDLISTQSGLLGVSASSSDMQDLQSRRASDPRADEAISLFCYTASKFVGALAASLNGIDILVFSGGIGEHSPQIRAQICQPLTHLGLILDPAPNQKNAPQISTPASPAKIFIIPTNEELIIAQTVQSFLK
jgi:acetate kinase